MLEYEVHALEHVPVRHHAHVKPGHARQAVLAQGLAAQAFQVGEVTQVGQHGGIGLGYEHAAPAPGHVVVVHVAGARLDEAQQGVGRGGRAAHDLARAVGPLAEDIGLHLGYDHVAYLHVQPGGGVLDVVLVLGVALVDGAGERAVAVDLEGLHPVAYLLDIAVAGSAGGVIVVHLHLVHTVDADLVHAGEVHPVAGSAREQALVLEGVVHVFAEFACKVYCHLFTSSDF